jgi:hypothetical protein
MTSSQITFKKPQKLKKKIKIREILSKTTQKEKQKVFFLHLNQNPNLPKNLPFSIAFVNPIMKQ